MGGAKMVLMRKWDLEEGLRLARRGAGHRLRRRARGRPPDPRAPGRRRARPRRPDLPDGWCSGSARPPAARAIEVFGDAIQILNGYGLTETTSAVVTNVGVEFAAHPDSVGRPNLTADVRVVDADGRAARRRRGRRDLLPIAAGGARATGTTTRRRAASFRDGWFHSGDIGYVDADGFLYVVDRMKDVVIRGGENVYCAEVEAVLHEHPAVAEVAVVGLDERAMGERVCAVVVPRPGRRRRPRRSARVRVGTAGRVQVPRGALRHRRAAEDRDRQGGEGHRPQPGGGRRRRRRTRLVTAVLAGRHAARSTPSALSGGPGPSRPRCSARSPRCRHRSARPAWRARTPSTRTNPTPPCRPRGAGRGPR